MVVRSFDRTLLKLLTHHTSVYFRVECVVDFLMLIFVRSCSKNIIYVQNSSCYAMNLHISAVRTPSNCFANYSHKIQ